MKPFSDRLAQAVRAKGSPLCVGLDHHRDHLPPAVMEGRKPTARGEAAAAEAFAEGVIAASAPVAVALKVNVAFYERLGVAGMRAYARALKAARKAKLLAIADVKRGDIGSTAQAYAEAHLGKTDFHADAVTLNALLGEDSLEPFLKASAEGAGLFVLVRTSNPGGPGIQGNLEDPTALSWTLAERVRAWGGRAPGRCGWSSVGAVVGATRGEDILRLRARMPKTPFLLPGIGAQGGSLADAAKAFDAEGLGGLATASRSIIFAHRERPDLAPARWTEAVADAAKALAGDLAKALRPSAPFLLLLGLALTSGCAAMPPSPPPAVPPSRTVPPRAPAAQAAPSAENPLDRPVSLALRECAFRSAVLTLSRMSKVPIGWDPSLPQATLDTLVDLEVRDMPLRLACAWLGRQADLVPVEAEGGLRLEAPRDPEDGPWRCSQLEAGALITPPPPPDLLIQRTGTYDRLMGRDSLPLTPPKPPEAGKPPAKTRALGGSEVSPLAEMEHQVTRDQEARKRLTQEARQALLETLTPLAYRSYEHPKPLSYLPGSDHILIAVQPERARNWMEETVRGLESPDPPSGLGREGEGAELDRRWALEVELPKGEVDALQTARALADRAGVSLGWDPRELGGTLLRRVTLPGGRLSFGKALGLIARKAGFVRLVREPGAGVWLVGPREEASAGRRLWEDRFTLGIYPVADLEEAMGVETLKGLLHSRLAGEPWQEPGAVISWHAPTKRLVLRHRPDVQRDVHALLALLRRESK